MTCTQVEVRPGEPAVEVQHLQLSGHDDVWSAEVAGRRLQGNVLLYSHAGEQVLTLWVAGRSHEFR